MGEFVMHRLFPIVCNMSLTASVVILAVLAVRRLLRRAPKVFSYALWAVVLFRLLCPVSVTSAVSLLGALGAPAQERTAVTSVVEYVPADIVRNMAPTVTPLPQEPFPAEPGENIVSTAPSVTQPAAAPASPLSGPVAVLTLTWLTGMALLLLYSVISLLRLRRRLVGAVRLEDNIYLAAENDVDEICGLIEKEKPELVVIDSIQTMRCMDISSSSGTVSQVKESAARLLAVAKKQEIPMFIVGHVNKDGAIAGPKVMEHIVDTVLYFEGDKMLPYRILRAAKNRYGSTNELGMFDMTGQGLEEIENPSQMLLEGRPLGVSGNCVACTMEGSRPILSEIQALATKTNFPAPRRACSGYDYNRMNLLIAVLEKRAGYFFGNLDVYINIVSGITLRDTACDLAVCLSMVSSLLDCPVSDKLIAIGEVGLGGEVRSVPNLEQRLREAERIGFERAVVPKHSLAHLNAADYPGMKLVGAAYISDAIHALKSDRL